MIKLHTVQGNYRGVAVLIAADLGRVQVQPQYIQWSELKSEANFKKNTLGQIPTLETQEGTITQTNAILRYIANVSNTLYGNDLKEKAEIDQLLEFIAGDVTGAMGPILHKIWGWKGEQTEESISLSKQATEQISQIFNEQLKLRTYLVGQSISIADIALFVRLVYALRCGVLDSEYRKKYSHLIRWFENISANSVFIKQFGKNSYATKPWF